MENADPLRDSLLQFYDDPAIFKTLKRIQSSRTVQPRLIDYFVTQYCKQNAYFFFPSTRDIGVTDIYNSYKLQLKGFHKKRFSLFDRKRLVKVFCGDECIEYSLPQLNVFRWIIENEIYEIMLANIHDIQVSYYEFRKESLKRSKHIKRKTTNFSVTPVIIKGVNVKLRFRNAKHFANANLSEKISNVIKNGK